MERQRSKRPFALAMALVWGIVFAGPTRNPGLGICMGLCMGMVFGLFDSGSGESGENGGRPEEAEPFPIRLLAESERDEALALAWRVFTEYESPDYAPEGTEEFRKTLRDETYLAGLRYYGAFDGEKLIGLLAIREERCHICFFFVDGAYHRRGIGTRLFARVREDFPGRSVTLNSSPYGLPFYRALGFAPTEEEKTVSGIRFTPMIFHPGT